MSYFTADAVRVYNSGSQSIERYGWRTLTFDSETYDNNALHDTSTNTSRLTCKTAGIYIIGGTVDFGYAATGDRYLAIYDGTNRIANHSVSVNSSENTSLNISCLHKMAVNDYVELTVYLHCPSDVNVSNHSFWMTMVSL